ncbi:MAG: hypothetical protein LAT55_12135 [Opitutales bacterium]|nr:hypothetical protein [Opitutales bacterium]
MPSSQWGKKWLTLPKGLLVLALVFLFVGFLVIHQEWHIPAGMPQYQRGYWAFFDEDFGEAFIWFKQSAEKGYDWGAYMTGYMLTYGLGTKTDLEEAQKWYEMAHDAGLQEAEWALRRLTYYQSQ